MISTTSTRLLTDDEIAAVAGGFPHDVAAAVHEPIQYAVSYWATHGVVGTMQDFVWQLTN